MKKEIFLAILCCISISCHSSNEIKVTAENNKNREVTQLVEINIDDLGSSILLAEGETFLVKNQDGIFLPSQLTYDNKLIFQVHLPAHSTQIFLITNGQKEEYEPQVFGRQFPERYDDFSWENDRIGFRFYGKSLKEIQAPTNGLDLWYKRTSRLVLEDWYRDDLSGKASYHVDRGEGCDPYGVGSTLGAGAMAPYIDGQLIRNHNYESYTILDNGPLRITAKLTYPNLQIADKEVEDIRIVSLDAGSQFTKITQSYGEARFAVAAGIVKRSAGDSILVSTDKHHLIYAEPAHVDNGQIYLGLIFQDGFDKSPVDRYTIGKDTYSHTLAVKEYKGIPLSYYTGFGWNKFGFKDVSQFEAYVKSFTERLSHPIVLKY